MVKQTYKETKNQSAFSPGSQFIWRTTFSVALLKKKTFNIYLNTAQSYFNVGSYLMIVLNFELIWFFLKQKIKCVKMVLFSRRINAGLKQGFYLYFKNIIWIQFLFCEMEWEIIRQYGSSAFIKNRQPFLQN